MAYVDYQRPSCRIQIATALVVVDPDAFSSDRDREGVASTMEMAHVTRV
jgi:hypothetical protein